MGNTQDIACRAWLKAQGYKVTQTGGEVLVIPTSNPDQLNVFQSGGVDAVWTVEPWVTRLEKDANARVFLEDKDCITTWLVSSVKFLKDHPDLAKKIVAANAELTQWIKSHPAEAQKDACVGAESGDKDRSFGGYRCPFFTTDSTHNEDRPGSGRKSGQRRSEHRLHQGLRRYFPADPKALKGVA